MGRLWETALPTVTIGRSYIVRVRAHPRWGPGDRASDRMSASRLVGDRHVGLGRDIAQFDRDGQPRHPPQRRPRPCGRPWPFGYGFSMGKHARQQTRERPSRALRLGAHGTGDRHGPIVEAWMLDGPLAELVVLHRADTPDALQRVMVIPGRRTDTDAHDAVRAFRRAFNGDNTGLVEAVVVACCHHRWKGVARQLLESLVEQGLLDGDQIGLLAALFLEADADLAVTAPGAWLVDYYLQQRDEKPRRLDPAKTYTLQRPVAPQVRRWAAREQVRHPDDLDPVLARAQALDSRHGAAVVLGLLDAADGLDADTAAGVIGIGLDWPNPSVRLTALQRLAAAGQQEAALERAETDQAVRIRRWATTQRQLTLKHDHGPSTIDAAWHTDVPPTAPKDRSTSQPALFD